ncbi:phosphoribosylanthranilate isomerase [Acidobacteriota bacterium]
MYRIKICGIVNSVDALTAVEYGADAIGFLIGTRHRAEDRIDPDEAAAIAASLPHGVMKVMVTHLDRAESIFSLFKQSGCSAVQVQEEVSPDELGSLSDLMGGQPVIKALHIGDPGENSPIDVLIRRAKQFLPYVTGIVLDSVNPGEDRIGGTGLTHDWTASRLLVRALPCPVILAGGLNPDNVVEAVERVEPYGVDVNSGVELDGRSPGGGKDLPRLHTFISRAALSLDITAR